VISDFSGYNYRNGGRENAVERAFRLITEGKDVLDALIEGVNIPELDPEETGIGYGALPNADGIVQLDASCMHGPKKRAGAVAAIEGVRTPSMVARAVADYTDNHLLAGRGAQDFARAMGFTVEADLNTERSRKLWLEWRRRVDPEHWLDPKQPSLPPAVHRSRIRRTRRWKRENRWSATAHPRALGRSTATASTPPATSAGHHHQCLAWKIPAASATPHTRRRTLPRQRRRSRRVHGTW
jgi:N4-(beta-N-acetylglucosaminyl)-L-asparaginase